MTSLFEAHAAHPFSPTEPAPSPHLQQQLAPVLLPAGAPGMRLSHSTPVLLGAQPSLPHPVGARAVGPAGTPHGPVVSESTSHSPGPPTAQQPGGEEQAAEAGTQPRLPPAGFSGAVLRGVARELQSVASAPLLGAAAGAGSSKEVSRHTGGRAMVGHALRIWLYQLVWPT